jgi:hypothetical protein
VDSEENWGKCLCPLLVRVAHDGCLQCQVKAVVCESWNAAQPLDTAVCELSALSMLRRGHQCGDVVVLIDNPLVKVCGALKRTVCSGQ